MENRQLILLVLAAVVLVGVIYLMKRSKFTSHLKKDLDGSWYRKNNDSKDEGKSECAADPRCKAVVYEIPNNIYYLKDASFDASKLISHDNFNTHVKS